MVISMGYIVKTRDNVFLDGIPLSTFGLAAEMPQPVPIAKPRYTVWSSGDSDMSEPDDSFEDVEYPLTVRRFRSPDDFRNPDFYAACATARTLVISRHPGRYYKIRRLIGITPTASAHGNELAYIVTFALAPFAYHSSNPEVAITENKLVNPGTRYSKPLYKITHDVGGDTILSVNGQTCTINYQASSPIYIDAERMIAYNDSGVNQTQHTSGLYPFLAPGMNLLSVVHSSGIASAASLVVKGNWRDY